MSAHREVPMSLDTPGARSRLDGPATMRSANVAYIQGLM